MNNTIYLKMTILKKLVYEIFKTTASYKIIIKKSLEIFNKYFPENNTNMQQNFKTFIHFYYQYYKTNTDFLNYLCGQYE